MSGIARLFDRYEVAALAEMVPSCELDHRFMQGLVMAVSWVLTPGRECAVCGKAIDGNAAYVMMLLPVDPDLGLGVSGGVCGSCGGLPRIALEAQATKMAILMFEPHQGRA